MANPGTDAPLWLNEAPTGGVPLYTAAELRQAMALATLYDGRDLGGRAGVRPGGTQLNVTYANPTLTVAPGVALIDDPAWTSTRGPYWVALPAAETHDADPADGSNPRKDIVVLRLYDDDEDSSGLRLARTEYIAGTPAASPAEPAVPEGAIRLATLDVPATGGGGLGSAAVTINFAFTAAAGGILPVRDSTEEAALNPYEGQTTYRLDTGLYRARGAAAWRDLGEVVVCTSAARPAHSEGRVIYETDTDRLLVSDGAAWVRIGHAAVGGRTGCRLRRAANQSIPNITATSISWDTEDANTDGFITAPSATITIPAGLGGLYAITFVVLASMSGRCFMDIIPTSAITGMPARFRYNINPLDGTGYVTATLPLLAGDTFICQAFHTSGAPTNFTAWLSCYRQAA